MVKTIPVGTWQGGKSCNPSNAYVSTPSTLNGRTVSTLAGWSLGRDGVLYELEFLTAIRSPILSQIKYVLMIDPGGYADLGGSCDSVAGSALAKWLRAVPDAHLVILSGP